MIICAGMSPGVACEHIENDSTRPRLVSNVVGLPHQVRVVRSAKDRSFEAIRTSVAKIRNHIKINDWNGIQADFDECNKHVDKSKVCRRIN